MALLDMISLLFSLGQKPLLDGDGNVDAGLVRRRAAAGSAGDDDHVGSLRGARIGLGRAAAAPDDREGNRENCQYAQCGVTPSASRQNQQDDAGETRAASGRQPSRPAVQLAAGRMRRRGVDGQLHLPGAGDRGGIDEAGRLRQVRGQRAGEIDEIGVVVGDIHVDRGDRGRSDGCRRAGRGQTERRDRDRDRWRGHFGVGRVSLVKRREIIAADVSVHLRGQRRHSGGDGCRIADVLSVQLELHEAGRRRTPGSRIRPHSPSA